MTRLGVSVTVLVQYANDTQFLHSGPLADLEKIIKEAETAFVTAEDCFLGDGLLLVKTNKTKCIFFGSRQMLSRMPEDTVVRFESTPIHPSPYVKNVCL